MSKCLVAPLNWGLGHASRCIPLVQRLLDEGHEVILGGDGESLVLLRKHFPQLRYVYLAPLNLRYSAGKRQVWAMLKAIPKLLIWSIKDHAILQTILREEPIDQIISDNRFGLYINHLTVSPLNGETLDGRGSNHQCECVYMTHQLHIMLPRGWKWAEGIASRLHARIYTRFNKVWVPDYPDPSHSLAGELSHPMTNHSIIPSFHHSIIPSITNYQYIGPLSRFSNSPKDCLTAERSNSDNGLTGKAGLYDIVAVLSGLEPHRTMLEQEIIARFSNPQSFHHSIIPSFYHSINHQSPSVLIVQGLMNRPNTRIKRGNMTIVPYMSDAELVPALMGAKHIIARSGYSTIMDLDALGLLNQQSPITNHQSFHHSIIPSFHHSINHQLELLPTPGQPEQEYLATLHNKMH